MPSEDSNAQISFEEILAFLRKTTPFNELSSIGLERMVAQAEVHIYQPGEMFLKEGVSKINHLRVVVSGKVKLLLTGEDGTETVFGYRESGSVIGALAILRESLSNLDAVAETEVVCLMVPQDVFEEMILTNAPFAQFYLKLISECYVGTALNQLRAPGKTSSSSDGSLYLFSARVGDVVRRKPVTIPGQESIRKAADLMNRSRVGSLLVNDPDGRSVGIITDRDLRKVVAQGLDFNGPVSSIMASPIKTIPAHTVCFDAMLEMMRTRVHHLVIERNGNIEGVLSGHDLMVLQGLSPLYLMRKITGVERIEELYNIALRSPRVVHSLILDGAKPGNITRMITLINDFILDRLMTLLVREAGPPPVPFCWLLMGSEGRKEQTYKTDQDNGLVYADPATKKQAGEAESYFAELSEKATQHLLKCGFPLCKGEIMASNPKWRQPLSTWKGYFDRWISSPEPKEVMNATIFFDFRPGWGELELGHELRGHLMAQIPDQDIFLRFLAQDCLTTPQAINFFRKIVVEKSGPHKNKLDLKHKGLVPFVDFARLMALRSGISATNTLERYQLLFEGGFLREDLYEKASQAYEIQMSLRIAHQDRLWETGEEPDNFIDPRELSELERNNLKEALSVVGDLRAYLKEEYQLGG